MDHLSTYIHLPPGTPSARQVREFFRLAFGEYRWFEPVHYGRASLHHPLGAEHGGLEALVAYYEEYKTVTVAAKSQRDFLMLSPSASDALPFSGWLTLNTSVTAAKRPSWRDAHARQVAEVMRLFGSPLAQAGLSSDIHAKSNRLVPAADGLGQEEVFTVRDYGEGLAGLYWRNFLGPPFVRLFGERLDALPEGTRQPLEGGLVLVQPYELPTHAGTPEAQAREREIIALLGPECFYDFAHHRPPTRRPSL